MNRNLVRINLDDDNRPAIKFESIFLYMIDLKWTLICQCLILNSFFYYIIYHFIYIIDIFDFIIKNRTITIKIALLH